MPTTDIELFLKPATLALLRTRNTELEQARAAVDDATQRLHDTIRPILTEAGYTEGIPVRLGPDHLVIAIPTQETP